MHCHRWDEESQKPQGDPTVGRPFDVTCALFAQVNIEDQADPQDHKEAHRKQMGRPVWGGISADKGDYQQHPNNEPTGRGTAFAAIPISLGRHDQRDPGAGKSGATTGILHQPGIAERRN